VVRSEGVVRHMFDWMKRRSSNGHQAVESVAPVARREHMSGKYLPLYQYLENRFAQRVVLRFGEIEDLLGFALPDPARLREDWWTNPDPDSPRPCYADSWILASRTAMPNLRALTVVFDRAS